MSLRTIPQPIRWYLVTVQPADVAIHRSFIDMIMILYRSSDADVTFGKYFAYAITHALQVLPSLPKQSLTAWQCIIRKLTLARVHITKAAIKGIQPSITDRNKITRSSIPLKYASFARTARSVQQGCLPAGHLARHGH